MKTRIDPHSLSRFRRYQVYTKYNPCQFSMTVDIDISRLRDYRQRNKRSLYAHLIYALSRVVQEFPRARYRLENDRLYLYDQLHPSFTIMNEQTKLFSVLSIRHTPLRDDFIARYNDTLTRYKEHTGLMPPSDAPQNCFHISMIPWASFTSFSLHLPENKTYFTPIFTFGKFKEIENRTLLPLAIQVHHAVCDGYHACMMTKRFEEICNEVPSL